MAKTKTVKHWQMHYDEGNPSRPVFVGTLPDGKQVKVRFDLFATADEAIRRIEKKRRGAFLRGGVVAERIEAQP